MKTLTKIWKWLLDAIWPFILGAIIMLLFLLACSCTVTRPVNTGDMDAYHQDLHKYYEYKQHKANHKFQYYKVW